MSSLTTWRALAVVGALAGALWQAPACAQDDGTGERPAVPRMSWD